MDIVRMQKKTAYFETYYGKSSKKECTKKQVDLSLFDLPFSGRNRFDFFLHPAFHLTLETSLLCGSNYPNFLSW
jgi:hypothetical protein